MQALQKAQACISDMEARVGGRRRLRKSDFNKLFKNSRAAFYWSQDDMLIYDTVETVWRPLSRGRFLVYKIAEVLGHLEISRAKLTTLGIVSKNDYTSNLARLGVITSHEIVKSLDEAETDVERLILQYLLHPDVVCKKPTQAMTHDDAQQCGTLEDILERLRVLRLQLRENKNRTTDSGQVEEPKDVFNRYSTVDRPPERRPRPHDSGRPYKYRKRFTNKTRSQLRKHDPPETMKQHKLKPWKSPPESPLVPSINAPAPKATPKKTTAERSCINLPFSSQKIPPRCTRISSRVKRTAQRAIGQYIERLSANNIDENDDDNNTTNTANATNTVNTTNTANATSTINATNATHATNTKTLSKIDRRLLDILCPAFSSKDLLDSSKEEAIQELDGPEGLEEHDDSLDKKNEALSFLSSLLTAIHSTKLPRKSGMGLHVRSFIEQAQDFLPAFTEGRTTEEYAGSSFLRSAVLQLSVELKKHYKNGAVDLHNKIEVLKRKKLLPPEARDLINPQRSSIENFVLLNRACGSDRSLVPMWSHGAKFINLSELDLTKVFWQDPFLRRMLQSYAFPDFPSLEHPDRVSLADVGLWLSTTTPGLLITKLLTDIGGYSSNQRKGLRNYSRSAFLMPLEEMRSHIQNIRDDSFEPASYTEKGYALRGSIRTDGFRLQVLAFKINELHSVKFRRLPAENLPCRLTSTIGGTDYFLTEIRNVVSTKQDVDRLWSCDPKNIKILSIDLGQAFVVGASAILPPTEQPSTEQRQRQDPDVTMRSLLSDIEETDESQEAEEPSPKFFNLAIKQKAVYQPTLKHRRWLEHRKDQAGEGVASISHIESSLPARRGPEANIADYVRREREVEAELDSFYGNVVLEKHKWNASKARAEEYRLIANRLLQLVGGSTGAKRDESNKVIIGMGLEKFSSKIRLASLHESFQSYFVQMARSLGYIVVGVNEYYTSKNARFVESSLAKLTSIDFIRRKLSLDAEQAQFQARLRRVWQ
ncbi:MAG: hypothetical protein J3R72DRAFT_501860 [Linnemannia gamsii]|nr:MAG: hypothetical protein J3R72DRAFT_501860 [Linnemannia gamsii]